MMREKMLKILMNVLCVLGGVCCLAFVIASIYWISVTFRLMIGKIEFREFLVSSGVMAGIFYVLVFIVGAKIGVEEELMELENREEA
ncbi:hypothetical protein IJI70_03560 [Candidatus Saccharibacteria bacterium]|nr:hypothetical protein [Candidatus Saccharibacteria bacterium]